MTPRHAGRTQSCGRPQAATRLAHAYKFFDAAELIATELRSALRRARALVLFAANTVTDGGT
jgi:hypothetical protein